MATAMAELPAKKKGRNRKPLEPRNPPGNNNNNILPSSSPVSLAADAGQENPSGLSLLLTSPNKKTKPSSKPNHSLAKELQEMQVKIQQLQIDKENTEHLLKERDEMLRRKEEELDNRGKEQEKLQLELKKLQKMKLFNPTMNLPLVHPLREREEEKKDKNKKKACPEMKKPSTPYILWCKDQWNEVKESNPDADFKEISNILGAKWNILSVEEKKPYEERYQADKESYLQIVGKEKREKEAMKVLEEEQKQKVAIELLEQYLQFKQEADKEKNKKTNIRKEHDPSKPKQPLSAFFLFTSERRAALLAEKKNILEISKIAGEEWKNMTEEQRAPYEEITMKHKENYLQEMEIYKLKKEEEAASLQKEEEEQMKIHKEEALQLLKKKEKTENLIKEEKEKRKKHKKEGSNDPNRPKKPATSFLLFSKETRRQVLQERPDISNSTLRALISVRWKELKEEEKEMWKDKAAKAMAAYKKEMEEYKKENDTRV